MFAMHDGWNFLWFGPLMGILWLLFWGAIIYAIVVLLRRRPDSVGGKSSALHLLEERYARGEINREEFEERRTVLLGGRPSGTTPKGS